MLIHFIIFFLLPDILYNVSNSIITKQQKRNYNRFFKADDYLSSFDAVLNDRPFYLIQGVELGDSFKEMASNSLLICLLIFQLIIYLHIYACMC